MSLPNGYALQDVVCLLRVPRSALGIICSSRGLVGGRLEVQEVPRGPWLSCNCPGGRWAPSAVCSGGDELQEASTLLPL